METPRHRRPARPEPARSARRRRIALALVAVAGALGILAGTVAARGPLFFISCDPAELAEHPLGQTSRVLGSDGAVIANIGPEEQWLPVELGEISPSLAQATIAIEDRRFREHDGVDYRGLVRALRENVAHRDRVEGGSTITQQLARTLYLGQEKSFGRKLDEACLAVELERRWEKDRILETYLNRVYFGNRAYGADAAARTYFSKAAKSLTVPEAALLAGVIQAPSALDPLAHPEAAKRRRDQVLQTMRETGALDDAQLREARAAELGLAPSPLWGRQRDAFLANHVQRLLVERYGENVVSRGGLEVHTTIAPRLQRLARQAIVRTLDRGDDPAAALVAVEPESGAIRAMAAVVPGQRSVAYDIAASARRQAGSTFKTFALAEAVDRGIDPWATPYLSAPFAGPDSGGEPWQVETYDGTYLGRVDLASATARSDNTVYARLVLDLGPEEVLDTARRLGIRSELPAVPSIVLGSGEVTPLELASAYGALANAGTRVDPRLVTKVVLPGGSTDEWPAPGREEALSPEAAFQVTRVLERTISSGTGTGAQIGRPAAGKTGTTDAHTDAWFAGYVPQLAAAVWMGRAERAEPMGEVHGVTPSGGTFPATIWARFMQAALEGVEPVGFAEPAQAISWTRFCGRFQFARSAAEARAEGGCPEPETTRAEAAPAQPAAAPPPAEPPPPPPEGEEEHPLAHLVGARGRVAVDIPPDDGAPPPELGEVDVRGERVLARSEDGAPLPAGSRVEVVAVEDDHVVVRAGPGNG